MNYRKKNVMDFKKLKLQVISTESDICVSKPCVSYHKNLH